MSDPDYTKLFDQKSYPVPLMLCNKSEQLMFELKQSPKTGDVMFVLTCLVQTPPISKKPDPTEVWYNRKATAALESFQDAFSNYDLLGDVQGDKMIYVAQKPEGISADDFKKALADHLSNYVDGKIPAAPQLTTPASEYFAEQENALAQLVGEELLGRRNKMPVATGAAGKHANALRQNNATLRNEIETILTGDAAVPEQVDQLVELFVALRSRNSAPTPN